MDSLIAGFKNDVKGDRESILQAGKIERSRQIHHLGLQTALVQAAML